MAKICYQPKKFRANALDIITKAEGVCETYAKQGYSLTLRQLYYQFVKNNWLANTEANYDRLGAIINDARLAGMIDWSHLEDRTRNLKRDSYWSSPADIIQSCVYSYAEDLWRTQPFRLEVWVEKEALVSVVARACVETNVPYFACKGYVSQSEMHEAAQRLKRHERCGQETVVIYLGDHDPSGIDMTRDVQDRLALFGAYTKVERIALNMDQVQQYNPPPNPAKLSDSRAISYIDQFGEYSWELDALDPATLNTLIVEKINQYRRSITWDVTEAKQNENKELLQLVADNWEAVAADVQEVYGDKKDDE